MTTDNTTKEGRRRIVNMIIWEISRRGRGFFRNHSPVATTDNTASIVDSGGQLFYRSEHPDHRLIALRLRIIPRTFPHGNSLWHLMKEFEGFIKTGKAWEYSQLKENNWGYSPEDMAYIQKRALELGYPVVLGSE